MEKKENNMTTKQKLANWWDYHKTVVLIVLAVILFIWFVETGPNNHPDPDYYMILVSSKAYDPETVDRLEALMAAHGSDCNDDGTVEVLIRPVQLILDPGNKNAATNNYINVSVLDADLAGGLSGLFLLEDPAAFQQITRCLDYTDGSQPEPEATDVERMAVACAEIPELNIPELEGMYLGGRWDIENADRYYAMFEALTR